MTAAHLTANPPPPAIHAEVTSAQLIELAEEPLQIGNRNPLTAAVAAAPAPAAASAGAGAAAPAAPAPAASAVATTARVDVEVHLGGPAAVGGVDCLVSRAAATIAAVREEVVK
ncbi:hypothetical protein [Flindersiella endophytica]